MCAVKNGIDSLANVEQRIANFKWVGESGYECRLVVTLNDRSLIILASGGRQPPDEVFVWNPPIESTPYIESSSRMTK